MLFVTGKSKRRVPKKYSKYRSSTAFTKLLSILSQCDEVASVISNTEITLYDLSKGKLSRHLMNTDSLAQTLNTLSDILIKLGYTLGLNQIIGIINSDCSFLSYEEATITILLHIPVYKPQTELSAYEYLNIPLTTTDNNTAVMMLQPEPIIAINLQNELFIELNNYELAPLCDRMKYIFVNKKRL